MEFSSLSLADVVVARPVGHIDHANAQALQQDLTPILNEPPAGTVALVLDFAGQFLPDDFDEVRQIFSSRGAYARFKDLLDRRGALDQWYDFEAKAEERALRMWCDLNSIEVGD